VPERFLGLPRGALAILRELTRHLLRRPVVGCSPGAVTATPVRTGVGGTGLLRALAIIR